jgi:hypothetical protein
MAKFCQKEHFFSSDSENFPGGMKAIDSLLLRQQHGPHDGNFTNGNQ